MIYEICECKKVIDKCVAGFKKILWLDRVDYNKYKNYTILNNIENKKVLRCIQLSFEYQEVNNISGECITNSILFYDILKCFGYFFNPRMVLSVGGYDLGENYTPHMVNYCEKLNIIIDSSYINYCEVKNKDFWYSFSLNKILKEATDKKIITPAKRFDIYRHYYDLNESCGDTIYELDYEKQLYYNNLLKYIKDNTGYYELDLLRPVNTYTQDLWGMNIN